MTEPPNAPFDEVRFYYRLDKEHDRLTRGLRVIEFARTCELLSHFLPAAPARILDVGGGTGMYARWLTGRAMKSALWTLYPSISSGHARQAVWPRQKSGTRGGSARGQRVPTPHCPLYHLYMTTASGHCSSTHSSASGKRSDLRRHPSQRGYHR